MSLGRVKLEIKFRFGEEKWQKTYADGNLFVSEVSSNETAIFTRSGI
jgi:hypothetical protein